MQDSESDIGATPKRDKALADVCYVPQKNDLSRHPRLAEVQADMFENRFPPGVHRHQVGHIVTARLGVELDKLHAMLTGLAEQLPESLLHAYAATEFRVDSENGRIVMTVGEYSSALASLLKASGADTACFITAWNPGSQPVSEQDNQKNQHRLELDIQKGEFQYLEGGGADPTGEWPPEASYLILGIFCCNAIVLAQKYGQVGVVWITADAIPRLMVTGGNA